MLTPDHFPNTTAAPAFVTSPSSSVILEQSPISPELASDLWTTSTVQDFAKEFQTRSLELHQRLLGSTPEELEAILFGNKESGDQSVAKGKGRTSKSRMERAPKREEEKYFGADLHMNNDFHKDIFDKESFKMSGDQRVAKRKETTKKSRLKRAAKRKGKEDFYAFPLTDLPKDVQRNLDKAEMLSRVNRKLLNKLNGVDEAAPRRKRNKKRKNMRKKRKKSSVKKDLGLFASASSVSRLLLQQQHPMSIQDILSSFGDFNARSQNVHFSPDLGIKDTPSGKRNGVNRMGHSPYYYHKNQQTAPPYPGHAHYGDERTPPLRYPRPPRPPKLKPGYNFIPGPPKRPLRY